MEKEYSIGTDAFGEIVQVDVDRITDLEAVPGVKTAYPTTPDPDQREKHHAVISNMKDLNGDGNMHVFRALIDKPYTRIACYDESGRQVWMSEKIAPGGDDESGMPVADIDGDGKYEIILSQWAAVYCIDAHTGAVKWIHELEKGGRAGPGGWDCPMVVGRFRGGGEISIVVRSGLNIRCLDGAGREVWHQPLTGDETYGHSLCRYDVNGDGLDEVFSARNGMIDAFAPDGTVLWKDDSQLNHSDNFAFGDIDGDGRCEVVYDHDGCGGKGPLYVADPLTGRLKYAMDYAAAGLRHCQGFTMDRFRPDLPGLQVAVVGKDDRLLLFGHDGELLWQHRVPTGLVTKADWNGDGTPEIVDFAVGYDLDPAWSVWNGKGERLFAMSFLPAAKDCRSHASMCGPGLGFDGYGDLDGNGRADILVAHGNWKTGSPQYHFIAEMPDETGR